MDDAPVHAGLSSLTLAFGREEWTTAVHVERAMGRLVDVAGMGPGNSLAAGDRRTDPLLWVESGVPWVPDAGALAGRRTAAWFIDTHRGWRWRAEVAQAFGVRFVAQRDAVESFRTVGVTARWLPLAAPEELCGAGPDLAERTYDVALVGRIDPGSLREQVLRGLGQHCRVAPVDGYLSPPRMMDLYRRSRIVINVPLAHDLNMRAFEALGARALLVTGPMEGARDILGEVPITVERRDPQEWIRAVLQTLASCDQGRADLGYEDVRDHHTYDHRVAELLRVFADVEDEQREEIVLGRSLAHAWARWGRVGETWACSHSIPLTARAGAMGLATALKRSAPRRVGTALARG